MPKEEKKDVDYSRGMAESHCGKVFSDDKGYCRFYHPDELDHTRGLCDKVIGEIKPMYWCRLFEKREK